MNSLLRFLSVSILFLVFCLPSIVKAEGAENPPPKEKDIQNFFVDGNLHFGSLIPFGIEKKSGVILGGSTLLRFESDRRGVLLFGELAGEGFSNDPSRQDVQFSRFMLNTALALGNKKVKWLTPINISIDRHPAINEEVGFRYAFSGLYLKPLDNTDIDSKKFKQVAEMVFNIVYESFSYMQTNMPNYSQTPCKPEDYECINANMSDSKPYEYVGSRDFLALYSKMKYELEKNNLGGSVELVLTQPVAFKTYTRVDASTTGFYRLKDDFSNLRLFVGVNGTIERDTVDPTGNQLEGVLRVFGGVGGRF